MRLLTAIRVIKDFIFSIRGNSHSEFMTPKETVDYVLNNQVNLIRFGDGEFNYINGKSVHYQEHDEKLKCILKEIIDNFIEEPSNDYLVAMPGDFLKCNGFKLLKKKSYFLSWSSGRRFFNKNYDRNIRYGDAFLFAIENKDIYKQIWMSSNVDHFILVHNDERYANQIEIESGKNCDFIKIPPKNAFSVYSQIYDRIISTCYQLGVDNTMVLISAGPCGKALAYELSKEHIWAIDTGHCFQNPLHLIKQ